MKDNLRIDSNILIGGGVAVIVIIGGIGVASLIGVETVTVLGGLALGGGIVVFVCCRGKRSPKTNGNGKSAKGTSSTKTNDLCVGLLIPHSDSPVDHTKALNTEEFKELVDKSAFFFAGKKAEIERLEKDLRFAEASSTKKTMYTYLRIETGSYFDETPTTKFSIKNLVTSELVALVKCLPLDSLDGLKAFRH